MAVQDTDEVYTYMQETVRSSGWSDLHAWVMN